MPCAYNLYDRTTCTYDVMPAKIRCFPDSVPTILSALSSAMRNQNIALILFNPDVIELMSVVLRQWKLGSRGVEPSQGAACIEELIMSCNSSVVVFDLDPPYARSAALVLQLMRRFPDRSFVLTCADPLLALASEPLLLGYPIFQKPYEPDRIADIVASMVQCTWGDVFHRHLSRSEEFIA
jgi:hypothetical protein